MSTKDAELDDERRRRFERIANSDTDSAKIAEAILKELDE